MSKHVAIFFDRDGVLNNAIVKNDLPYPPASIDEVYFPQYAQQAVQKLKQAGFLLICVTNQPDVARGNTNRDTVEAINTKIVEAYRLDAMKVCYHDDNDRCQCRKPLPGLLLNAANEFKINLSESFMIGDRWKDIEAGKNAGCKTLLLDNNYSEKKFISPPDFIAHSLLTASEWILNKNRENKNARFVVT